MTFPWLNEAPLWGHLSKANFWSKTKYLSPYSWTDLRSRISRCQPIMCQCLIGFTRFIPVSINYYFYNKPRSNRYVYHRRLSLAPKLSSKGKGCCRTPRRTGRSRILKHTWSGSVWRVACVWRISHKSCGVAVVELWSTSLQASSRSVYTAMTATVFGVLCLNHVSKNLRGLSTAKAAAIEALLRVTM